MARSNFGSKLGVVLATAGSAVGLGNIWRFPTMTGENGGAAFILVYLVFVFLLGVPAMLAEFSVGRKAHTNAPRAFRMVGGRTPFAAIGYVGALGSMIIFGFYSVIAGWCMHYLYASLLSSIHGTPEDIVQYFQTFSSNAWQPLLWTAIFMLLTHLVIWGGVNKGIERCSKAMMPLLFIILIIIVIASLCVPDAYTGIEFLFKPDFGKVNASTLLSAMGQAFFTLSLGVACLATYASYFDENVNMTKSAVQIALIDTVIAILAGLMIFPAAFSVGVQPDAGPSLIFITLPNVFQSAFAFFPGASYVISILFYGLLVLAALTSTISMHEIGTAFLNEEFNISRGRAATIVTVSCFSVAVLSSLSLGVLSDIKVFGMGFLDFFDFFTGQIIMPVCGLLTCILVGWYMPKTEVYAELTNKGTVSTTIFKLIFFAIRYICPIGITVIFLNLFGIL
ncbi:MAG: sodium-dependent transporter [Prevotella sp.]|nr:sodium-dependent transporter [Prevotella sp.]